MSKIENTVQEMIRYLSGNDLSDTPQMRQNFAIYSAACREVNDLLRECRNMFDKGLYIDAQRFCSDLKPSLSERVNMLLLSRELQERYRKVCSLYNYESAELPDDTILKRLQAASSDMTLNSLVLHWRQIARGHDTQAKINLLREIVDKSPQNPQIWINNLRTVEQEYLAEQRNNLEKAIALADTEKIVAIYNTLIDKRLISRLPEYELSKYQPEIIAANQKLLRQQLKNKSDEIFAAYSKLDHASCAAHLQEYDQLTASEYFVSDADMEKAIAEVRTFLQTHQHDMQIQAEFNQKKAELLQALDQRKSYTVVENMWEALRQMDMPLEKNLSSRVENLHQEYLAENNRKHIRKCILGVLSVLLLAAGAAAIFHFAQSYQSYRHHRAAMQELLQQKCYSEVIAHYNKINEHTPSLLKYGQLTALKLEAEHYLQEQASQTSQLDDLCRRGNAELAKAEPSLETLNYIIKELSTQKKDFISSESAGRIRNLELAVRKFELDKQQKADQAFQKKFADTVKQLDKLINSFKPNGKYDEQTVKQALTLLKTSEALQKQSGNISTELYQSSKAILAEKNKQLALHMQSAERGSQLLKKLQKPANADEYCRALEQMPLFLPQMAAGSWQEAVSNVTEIRQLSAGASLPAVSNSHSDFIDALNQLHITDKDLPMVQDALKQMPLPGAAESIDMQIKKFDRDFSGFYNCYEISLSDAEGRRFNFYAREEPPPAERSMSTRNPKSISLKLETGNNAADGMITFRIRRSNDKYFIMPVLPENTPLQLPGRFTKVNNFKLTRPEIPQAQHYTFQQKALKSLKAAQTLAEKESVLIVLLKDLKSQDDMNIFARAALTRELLNMLPALSGFYTETVNKYTITLDSVAGSLYGSFMQPELEQLKPDQTRALKKFFNEFDPARMEQYCQISRQLHRSALSRGLYPCGIIQQNDRQNWQVHYFDAQNKPDELWFYDWNSNKFSILLQSSLQENIIKNSQGLKFKDGMIFFAPADGISTAKMTAEAVELYKKMFSAHPLWPDSWPLNRR